MPSKLHARDFTLADEIHRGGSVYMTGSGASNQGLFSLAANCQTFTRMPLRDSPAPTPGDGREVRVGAEQAGVEKKQEETIPEKLWSQAHPPVATL